MTFYLLLTYILIVNLIAFSMMGADKKRARKNQWRISESTLFLLALIGGAFGIYFGMKSYRHKTKSRRFVIGIPLLCVVNLAVLSIITVFFMS